MTRLRYPDERIDQVLAGAALTAEERADLQDSLPNFEECRYSPEELQAKSDQDLMQAAVWIWQDYCR